MHLHTFVFLRSKQADYQLMHICLTLSIFAMYFTIWKMCDSHLSPDQHFQAVRLT